MAKNRYPEMTVEAEPYPVPAWKVPIIRAAQGVQMGLLGMAIFGDKVFASLNMPPPAWYTTNVANNKFGVAMGVWFVGNMLVTNLQNTGAFEVYFDGQLIFSKLAEGRMPTVPEIMGPVDTYFVAQHGRGGLHGRGAQQAVGGGKEGREEQQPESPAGSGARSGHTAHEELGEEL